MKPFLQVPLLQVTLPRCIRALALLAPLAGVAAGSAMAQPGPADAFNRAFWDSARTSATEACLKSGKEAAKGRLSDELVAKYCDCTVKASMQGISTVEAMKNYLAGQMSPELKAKLQERAQACAKETFPPRS